MTDYSTETPEERAVRLRYKNKAGCGKVGDLVKHDQDISRLLAAIRERLERVESLYQEQGMWPMTWEKHMALDDLQTGLAILRETV